MSELTVGELNERIEALSASRNQKIKRIAELEASLADSNEALQILGLKLAQAEGHSATAGLRTRDGDRILLLPGANILIVSPTGCELISIYSGFHTRYLDCYEESFVLAALDYSSTALGGPTPVTDAAPACEQLAMGVGRLSQYLCDEEDTYSDVGDYLDNAQPNIGDTFELTKCYFERKPTRFRVISRGLDITGEPIVDVEEVDETKGHSSTALGGPTAAPACER